MPTLYTRRAIFVVLENRAPDANNIAKVIDVAGGERAFMYSALSPNGLPPVSHYWCSWACTEAEWANMVDRFAIVISRGWAWMYDGLTTSHEQVLAIHNLQPCPSPNP